MTPAGQNSPDPISAPAADLDSLERAVLQAVLAGGVDGQSILLLCAPQSALPRHLASSAAKAVHVLVRNPYEMPAQASSDAADHRAPQFILGKWEDGIAGHFDQIVCLFSQLAMPDPIGCLRRLMRSAGSRIVVELAAPRFADTGLALGVLARLRPLLWLVPPLSPGRQIRRGILFTSPALRNFFRYQSAAFEPVEIFPAAPAGHLIGDARRRRIRNLVVVSGPSSAGKSMLARRLMEDASYRESFGFHGAWEFSRGRDLVNLRTGAVENLFAELDLLAIEREAPGSYDAIPQFDVFTCAENITVLTVLPENPPGVDPMSPKEKARIIRKCGRLGTAITRYYAERADRAIIRHLYTAWFDWVRRWNPKEMRLVVNDFREFHAVDFAEFDRRLPPE
jgi:hypothetical protein